MRKQLTALLLASLNALGAFATPMLVDGGVDVVEAGQQRAGG